MASLEHVIQRQGRRLDIAFLLNKLHERLRLQVDAESLWQSSRTLFEHDGAGDAIVFHRLRRG